MHVFAAGRLPSFGPRSRKRATGQQSFTVWCCSDGALQKVTLLRKWLLHVWVWCCLTSYCQDSLSGELLGFHNFFSLDSIFPPREPHYLRLVWDTCTKLKCHILGQVSRQTINTSHVRKSGIFTETQQCNYCWVECSECSVVYSNVDVPIGFRVSKWWILSALLKTAALLTCFLSPWMKLECDCTNT